MKLKGTIELQKTPGRQDPWVTQKVPFDYFLSLKITEIDGMPITTCKSGFEALKDRFPKLTAGNEPEELNGLFQSVTLPPNAADVLHVTLGNFPDFRVGRSVANGINDEAVTLAEDIVGAVVELELPDNAFELVTTSEHHSDKLTFEGANITKASGVGFKRDTVINLLPTKESQDILKRFSRQVFGPDFVLWNGQSKPLSYHVTIAQTDKLNALLKAKFEVPSETEVESASAAYRP